MLGQKIMEESMKIIKWNFNNQMIHLLKMLLDPGTILLKKCKFNKAKHLLNNNMNWLTDKNKIFMKNLLQVKKYLAI